MLLPLSSPSACMGCFASPSCPDWMPDATFAHAFQGTSGRSSNTSCKMSHRSKELWLQIPASCLTADSFACPSKDWCRNHQSSARRESQDRTVDKLRENVLQLFFKRLTSPDAAIVEAARSGLAAVVANQRLPKALLQVGIPLYMNIHVYI